jgi:two-component system sensor histidine kinase ChvG
VLNKSDISEKISDPDSQSAQSEADPEAESSVSEKRSMRGVPKSNWIRKPVIWFNRSLRWIFLSSLTRRIVFLNLGGLAVLVTGILYLNQFREGLIDARVESLRTQAQIIAGAIAAQASVETGAITVDPELLLELEAGEAISPRDNSLASLESSIDPVKVAPVLKQLISPTRTRARIFDSEAILLLDSRNIYSSGQVLRFDLPDLDPAPPSLVERFGAYLNTFFGNYSEVPTLEAPEADPETFNEVTKALTGSASVSLRRNASGGLVVSVAVPVQRFRAVLGVLLLSTQGGAIDEIVRSERLAIVRVFLVAAGVTIVLSVLLASTIANPLQRLSAAAKRVRRSVKARSQIPDLSERGDEVGELSGSLREMTAALYARIDAIESFAADVSHELKNPLTSLRSAVETLPLAKTPEMQARLMDVIQHDVKRLDRLITDISDASRLDAELAREDASPLDIEAFLHDIVRTNQVVSKKRRPMKLRLQVKEAPRGKGATPFYVAGHEIRLGQVFSNIIENGRSFVGDDGEMDISLQRVANRVEITFEDNGPGISANNIDRIFERFYTDRPGAEAFGQNSGLGLSISRQIVEAHQGTIIAENRKGPGGKVLGARFTIVLPALDGAGAGQA